MGKINQGEKHDMKTTNQFHLQMCFILRSEDQVIQIQVHYTSRKENLKNNQNHPEHEMETARNLEQLNIYKYPSQTPST